MPLPIRPLQSDNSVAASQQVLRGRRLLPRLLPYFLAALVLALSLTITYAVWRNAQQAVMRDLQTAFDFRVREIAQRIGQRMATYEQVLRGAQGFWHASSSVSREEFRTYVASLRLEEHFPGIQGVAIARVVPKDRLEQHIAAVRAEGFPDYSIHPQGDRDIYTSITQIEPFAGLNLRAHGYDMFSEPVRRAAMERARDSSAAALSGKVTLVQELDRNAQPGFLIYLPIFQHGKPSGTVAERRDNLQGWVYAPFRMHDLMRGLGGGRPEDLVIRVFDGEGASDAGLLYAAGQLSRQGAARPPLFSATQHVHIAGRTWTLAIESAPGFERQVAAGKPQSIAVAGASVGVLLALLVLLLATGRRRALHLANEMTREIKQNEEALRQSHARMEEAQRALQHAQKLEAVGKLTGGVAHDFNNVLQIIAGNLQLLQLQFTHDEQVEKRLAGALSAVERGAKLSAQLLAFARRQSLQPRVVSLRRVIENMDDLLRQAVGESIEINTIIAADLWNTLVDPNHLENVILNLALNSRDAMAGKGKLTLKLCNAALGENDVNTHPDVRAGEYVLLAISDTGSGMSGDVMEQAFEPFFTTKPEGQGTGLGLSMAYGFVKQSDGHIEMDSEVGRGTSIRIYLPRSTGETVEMAAPTAAGSVGGSETILVVEDDAHVRATVVAMLTDLGYRVIQAGDAESALRVVKSAVPFDLLFTDVVMPGGMRGPQLAREVKAMRPEVAVLFTSGYMQNAMGEVGRIGPEVNLLSKPYRREQLARKLRLTLATAQG